MPNKKSKILSIETSCDETAAAVIIAGHIKSNVVASSADLQSRFGGVVPEVAAREHVKTLLPVIKLALKQARVKLAQIDYIAVTQGPGLITSLMNGINTAQALSVVLNKPLIPINHLEAHIYANFISKQSFPAIILIVSGGHTMLVLMKGHGQYQLIGETIDDAAGEAFDKTAKLLGLGYPGGPLLSKLAEKGQVVINFPRPMINSPDFNFSFAGLKTAVLYEVQKHKTMSLKLKANFSKSIEEAITDVLIAKLEKAIKQYKPKTIMLGGGVAANKLLRQRFQLLTTNYSLQTSIPAFEYCTDNAAMIGLAAYYRIKHKKHKVAKTIEAKPQLELG